MFSIFCQSKGIDLIPFSDCFILIFLRENFYEVDMYHLILPIRALHMTRWEVWILEYFMNYCCSYSLLLIFLKPSHCCQWSEKSISKEKSMSIPFPLGLSLAYSIWNKCNGNNDLVLLATLPQFFDRLKVLLRSPVE